MFGVCRPRTDDISNSSGSKSARILRINLPRRAFAVISPIPGSAATCLFNCAHD